MEPQGTEKRLTHIAGFLGLVQGLTWFVFALICIVMYIDETKIFENSNPYYMDTVGQTMYYFFLGRETGSIFTTQTMTPKAFFGFAWVYLILNAIWLCISYAVVTRKKNIKKTLTGWSHLTLTISVLDLVMVIILGADYNKCLDATGRSWSGICANGVLPVLAIVARGFTLWIVNVIFAIYLMKMAKRIEKTAPQPRPISTLGSMVATPVPHATIERGGQYSPSPVSAPRFQNFPRDGFRQYSPQTPQSATPRKFDFPPRFPQPDYPPYGGQQSRY